MFKVNKRSTKCGSNVNFELLLTIVNFEHKVFFANFELVNAGWNNL